MAAKNRDYWKKRFIQIEQAEHKQGIQCYADIEKQYRKAQRQIEGQIEAWYGRFADNNGITLTDARKLLTNRELKELKWDVQEYIRYGEENAINGQWVKQLENASARFHINRLEAIRLQMQQSLEVMFGNQLDTLDKTMQSVYKDGFYRTAFEIQKGVGVGWDFGTLDEKQISKVINKSWAADGKNFSARIWENKQKLVNELNTTLTQGIVLGQDPQKTIDAIARKMNTSKNNAGRLVMTEQAFFSETSQHDSFNELGVERYEIVATLDSHTSETCQDMDGKKFKMSEWEVGVTAPPFHVWCRTTTVPAFDDEFDLIGERAARGEDGKTYYVPSTMTYKEWQKSFVNGDKSGLKESKPDDTMKEKPKTFKEKIQKVRDDIAANGGKVEEKHLLEAGKALADDFATFKAPLKTIADEAKTNLDRFSDELNAIDKRQKELRMARRGFKNLDEVGLKSMDELAAEERKLSDRYMSIRNSQEYTDAYNTWFEANKKYNGTQADNIAWLKEKLGEIRVMGSGNLPVKAHLNNSRSPVRKFIETAYSNYPHDWVQKSVAKGNLKPKKVDRGYYSEWSKEIAISGWTDESSLETALHELGHRFERAVPAIRDMEEIFYKRRTAGEKLEWLGSGYARSEVTRKDDFISPYMGKDYNSRAYELVSMGFQYAYTDPLKLATDSDMQSWIYGILALL